jgi:prepilin-type N-terminal cleavage/methylation domain-containing protein
MKSLTTNGNLGLAVSAKPRMNPKPMKMKKLRKDQRGFSILELLMVIALTGLIAAAITTTFFQFFNMNTRTANHMIAVSQVQQAGKLVSEDMLEAQVDRIDDSPSGGKFLILGWANNITGDHDVTYTLEDSELWREETISNPTPTTTSVRVAEYIDPTKTSCDWDDNVLTFTVTATVGDESETRVYQVKPRPSS